MSSEIPSALICQLQAGLRREAGLPSYDPDGQPLPPLPSVVDAVAALDPDPPPSLRCDRCRGGLLRGPQSTLCIYCGADRGKEGFSHSISFNSTVGCRKLLDFLGLDESEAVLLDTEPNSSNKGQDTPKSELVLSDLLNLELRWPSDIEDIENSGMVTTSSPHAYALSSSVVDLDNFFSKTMSMMSSIAPEPNQKLMLRQNRDTKSHVSSGSENFAAFENLHSAESKTSSHASDFANSFAVWDAEFQPASTKNSAVGPKSLNLFQDSSIHSLAHVPRTEATVDKVENIEMFGETKSGLPSSVNKQFQDDLWPRGSAKDVSAMLKHETHDGTVNSVLNSTSNLIGGFSVQEDLWPTSGIKESEISNQINSNDDSFDAWQDFTSSIGAKRSSSQGTETMFKHPSETNAVDLFPASSKTELDNNKTVFGNNDAIDEWPDFATFGGQGTSSSLETQSDMTFFEYPLEIQSVDPLHTSSKMESGSVATMNIFQDSSDSLKDFTRSGEAMGISFNQGAPNAVTSFKDSSETKAVNPWPTSNTNDLDKNKALVGDDDSFDDWQDCTSFAVGPERSLNLGAPSGPLLFEQPSETKPAEIWPKKGTIESTNAPDDSFYDWQDFTRPIEAQGGSSSSAEQSKAPLFAHPSETNLVHQQDMKFVDVLQIVDSFDALEGQKGYLDEKDCQLDALTSDRTKEMGQKTATDPLSMTWDAKETFGSSNVNSNSESAESNVEKLASQMHDLSFMLADELSIPEKSALSEPSV